MLSASAVNPSNCGWIIAKLDQEEIDFLWSATDNRGESVKGTLAGNISGSFSLADEGDWFFNRVLIPLVDGYKQSFGDETSYVPVTSSGELYLSSLWVNFQNEGEFNPPHTHGGVYSFAVWLRNPVTYEDQLDLPMVQGSNSPSASTFQFYYQDILGRPSDQIYKMGKDVEGTLLFFPSSLRHLVFPFYGSSETRVSISGNLSIRSN